ncbi:unnamed protein product [Ilex paraguariensis]|uniref:Uncharacterized protein n=1 Tax=Ilex paraguariensis TaxID=185542 RepID=A0ABC8TQC9_9AQUA
MVRDNPFREFSENYDGSRCFHGSFKAEEKRSLVEFVCASRVVPSPPPPFKRARTNTPSSSLSGPPRQASLIEEGLEDAPPLFLVGISSSPRDGSSTATGIEA